MEVENNFFKKKDIESFNHGWVDMIKYKLKVIQWG